MTDVSAVRECLGPGEEYEAWITDLARAKLSRNRVEFPHAAGLRELLERMEVRPEDAEEIALTQPDPDADPELWWLLTRCRAVLVGEMGRLDGTRPDLPHLPESLGAKGRYFYVHVFLAALPDLLRHFELRGIPADVIWPTLADLGRQLAIHRRIYGRGGLDVQFWIALHFRGLIYDMGRLQFNRGRVGSEPDPSLGAPYHKGDFVLGVHIPETGPMTPGACDESFRRAREFYARYFPEESYRYAACTSWLLDEQLAEYLPESSNIVRFLRRFQLTPEEQAGDRSVFQFVFRRTNPVLDELPQRTSLERAVVAHLKAGRHWKVRTGWLEL